MHDKYAKQGLVILTVTIDNPKNAAARADVEKFLAKKVPPFRTLNLDADPEKLPPPVNFGGEVPAGFVFNRDNRYVKKLPLFDAKGEPTEFFDYDVMEKAVSEALQKK
jgi:hypothetical protein